MSFYTLNHKQYISFPFVPSQNRLPRLMEPPDSQKKEVADTSFKELLFNTIKGVNDLQNKPYALTEKMITEPDSVDIHDVTIALAQAQLSLSMTKTIFERAIRAYSDIVNIR